MLRLVGVCVAGAVGAGTRYLVSLAALRFCGPSFPVGTVVVNLVGCFLMGGVVQYAALRSIDPTWHLTITVGFLGGLTTYSSFNEELLRFNEQGFPARAALYFGLTVIGALAAGVAGGWLVRRGLA
jgi:CrcB protein